MSINLALVFTIFPRFYSHKNVPLFVLGVETTMLLERADNLAKVLAAEYPDVPILRTFYPTWIMNPVNM
jgi:hypothetical protein